MSIASIIFCIVLGAAFFIGYYIERRDNRVVKSWSKTNGKILKKDVYSGPRPMSADLYLKYEYYVNGERYESNNIYRNVPHYRMKIPYNLDELEFLKNPEVKYDPQNPSDCCLLIPDHKLWMQILMIFLGIMLSLFGWIGLLLKILK